MDDEQMQMLGALLLALWQIDAEWPDKPCTLAKLSKQSQRPMSVLRRQLTVLADAGLLSVALDEGAVSGTVTLSAAGRALAADLARAT